MTVDATAPAAPGAILAPASDSGVLGDGLTNDTTPTISGTGTAGDKITVVIGGQTLTTTVAADGTWSVTPTALADGVYSAVVTATDPAGNVSAPTNVPVTVDATAPAAPTAPTTYNDNVAPITNANSSAPVTNDATPGINIGALPAGVTGAILYVDGVAVPATYNPSTGTLTPNNPLADGPHSISYAVVDAAGNQSGPSPAMPLTIDTAAVPTPTRP